MNIISKNIHQKCIIGCTLLKNTKKADREIEKEKKEQESTEAISGIISCGGKVWTTVL